MKRKLLTILLATAACGALIGAVGCTGESSSGGGTEWFTGTASPNEQIEADIGDFYLDEDDFDIYRYTADGWALIGNIKGEDGATGPTGPAGENGEDGKDGADGATGPAGENGEDGKDGADGKTPYIGDNGNWWIGTTDTGVKAEGQDGADGATGPAGPAGENGEDGKDGADGETPYIGDNGNWWIGTTDTGVKAEGQDGADGATGPAGPAGENGEDGKGIADIEISYTIDNDGKECIVFVITYTDQTFDTITVPVPKRVINFDLQETSFAMCEEGEEPELTIWVNYDDGTGENIVVTEDMFSPEFDTIDFQTAGDYYIGITYQGMMRDFLVNIYDPNDTTVTNISVNSSRVIWLVNGEGKLVPNYTGLSLVLNRVNGTNYSIPLETSGAKFVLPEDFVVGEEAEVRVTYEGFETSFYVFPVNESEFNSDNYTLNNAFITSYSGDGAWNISCPLNGEPFNGEYFLFLEVYLKSSESTEHRAYYMPLTSDMLLNTNDDSPFDSALEGINNYYIDSSHTFGFNMHDHMGEITINVYDTSNLEIGSISIYGNNEILAGSVSELEFEVQYYANGNFVSSETISASEVDINGDYSLIEIGEYDIEVKYNGFTTRVYFTVYDPDICNIRDMHINGDFSHELYVGSDIEVYLTENIIGKELWVNYYEPVDGMGEAQITITRDMIDASGVDVSAPGSGEIVISYALPGQQAKTYTISVTVNIDMSSAVVVDEYKMGGAAANIYTGLTCYDNGYAYLRSAYGSESDMFVEYETDGQTVTVYSEYMGTMLFSVSVESELTAYIPAEPIANDNIYIENTKFAFGIAENYVVMYMHMGDVQSIGDLMPVLTFRLEAAPEIPGTLEIAGGIFELTPGVDGAFGTATMQM